MMPGLAGFVVSGDTTATQDDAVETVLTTLGDTFAVVHEPAARTALVMPRRRTWLDTFDWRLYRAGFLLEYVPARGGGELRLSEMAANAATTTEAVGARLLVVQHVAGWQAARPHLASDLPVGLVADRVGSIIAPRALLPVVTVTSTASVSRLLNEDAKTVARLLVERPVLGTNGNSHPFAPRVSIAEVRGYSGPARRAARIVGETPGFAPAEDSPLVEALAALGRRPADYSNKISAAITAGMPSAQAVAVIMLRLLDMVEVNTPGVLKDVDTEFLHDFRVAVRRTRAALKLLGGSLDRASDVARFAAAFKWLGDITTPTRDLDVHLLGFEDMASSLKAAKPDDLEPFRAYLRERRAKEYRTLVRTLRTARFRDLTHEWRAFLTPASEGKRVKFAKISAATLAAESTRRAFVKVARMGGAITPDSPAQSLHDLRKRAKELRYALEFFAPLHTPGTYGRVIGDLKRLQDCLGTFQDNEVQIGEIRSLATAMLATDEVPAVTLLAMGEITAGLAAGQAAARADFGRRFADFAGMEGQRRMSALLRGENE